MESYGLSARGAANVEAIWPRIASAVADREQQTEDSSIDMGTSENWLLRHELIDLYKRAVQDDLASKHLSYPDGFSGDQELLRALSHFFNRFFKPCIPVETAHLATAPGAAYALDALLYNICAVGDAILIPTPCWNGFDWLVKARSGVQPRFVKTQSLDRVFTSDVIEALEAAFSESTISIKGLLFTNPQNPLGQCYPESVIKDIIDFCNRKKIHFISDEIYALSRFSNMDTPDPVPFVSALQIDVEGMGCDSSHVHTIWSTSKDLGSSGLRMGCCITQNNKPLAVGLALACNTQMSSLTAIASSRLLMSPELPHLLHLNSERLGRAYGTITSMLKCRGLTYIPANMGPFLFARLVPDAQTWEDEADTVHACKEAGVSISAGRGYHVPDGEKGWARLNFALDPDRLAEALRRLGVGLDSALRKRGTVERVGEYS